MASGERCSLSRAHSEAPRSYSPSGIIPGFIGSRQSRRDPARSSCCDTFTTRVCRVTSNCRMKKSRKTAFRPWRGCVDAHSHQVHPTPSCLPTGSKLQLVPTHRTRTGRIRYLEISNSPRPPMPASTPAHVTGKLDVLTRPPASIHNLHDRRSRGSDFPVWMIS